MELLKDIAANWPEILLGLSSALGAFSALLAALYTVSLQIKGDQPDKAIKFLLDFTEKYSKK